MNGKKLSWLSEFWNDGAWDGLIRTTYFYDTFGRDSCHLEEQGDHDVWWVAMKEWFTYGASGDLIFDTHSNWQDSCWRDGYRFAYAADGNHRILSEQTEWWTDTLWFTEHRRTYSYDAIGRQLGWLYETWADSQWVNETRWDYTYDAEGRVSSWTSAYWDTSGWEEGRAGGFSIVDSAKNEYWWPGSVWVMLRYKTIEAGVNTAGREVPGEYALFQNYPNPFNPSTTIRYSLPHRSYVTLTIFNTLGQQVATLANGEVEAGYHDVQFNASGLASGMYFYQLTAGEFTQVRKFVLVR